MRHAKRWSVHEAAWLAGLRYGEKALFTTGRAAMFGSDDTGPNSSLVGRRKETPLFSPSGGTIGHDQRRERHAHRLVSTPAVARPYISPVRVTDQATGSTLTRVLVFVAERSCTKRYVTAALATFARASWLPRPTRTRQRGWLRPLSPMPGPSRNSCPRPDGPSTPRLAAVSRSSTRRCRRVASSLSQADARALTAPHGGFSVCIVPCKLHSHDRRGR